MRNTIDTAQIVSRYLDVWSIPDAEARARAVAEIWTPDGVEFLEGTRFRGHAELVPRVTEAYETFVESGKYSVTSAGDTTMHDDVVTFTIQLTANDSGSGDAGRTADVSGAVAWAARVFLVLDPGHDGLIREDYHLTVQPLAV